MEAAADALEDRPRSKSSASSHHDHTASQHHHHRHDSRMSFVRAGGAGAAEYDVDGGGDTRVTTIPPAHQLYQQHHEHARLHHPHRGGLDGSPGESQDQYNNPRMEASSVPPSGFGSAGLGGRQGRIMEHHHHRRGGGGGDGSGAAAARAAATRRPFSASPDVPDGRRGSMDTFSSSQNGYGDGSGDYDLPLLRSASCRPYSELQQQQHSRGGSGGSGGGGGRRGSLLSLSSSLGDNAAAAAGPPVPPYLDALDWSGVSDVQRDIQVAAETSVFGGLGSRQKQQQQWEQRGARERAVAASVSARPKVRFGKKHIFGLVLFVCVSVCVYFLFLLCCVRRLFVVRSCVCARAFLNMKSQHGEFAYIHQCWFYYLRTGEHPQHKRLMDASFRAPHSYRITSSHIPTDWLTD